jgi:hypothetical protein
MRSWHARRCVHQCTQRGRDGSIRGGLRNGGDGGSDGRDRGTGWDETGRHRVYLSFVLDSVHNCADVGEPKPTYAVIRVGKLKR